MSDKLHIQNYSVTITETGKQILCNSNLEIKKGEVVVLVGRNGVGKSSFAMSLLNIDGFEKSGSTNLNDKDITCLEIEDVARSGLFVSFQSPPEIDGVSLFNFIQKSFRSIYPENEMSSFKLKKLIHNSLKEVGLDESFLMRNMNQGFSGGEKRKAEFAQMMVLNPRYAVLDEVDSGLDISSTIAISKLINILAKEKGIGFLIISHNLDFIQKVSPDRVIEMREKSFYETSVTSITSEILKVVENPTID